MNRESIIKEFEEKQKDDARVYFEHCEHYTDEFVEWLLSKVIAQGEDNERLKPEKGGLRPDEYMHEWMEQDAVGFDLPPEEIIEHLCRDNRLLQEKYDKLKEENANLGATNETAALTGWICPSCDNSNHPFVTICSCGDAKK